jgi:hypothetical protein
MARRINSWWDQKPEASDAQQLQRMNVVTARLKAKGKDGIIASGAADILMPRHQRLPCSKA